MSNSAIEVLPASSEPDQKEQISPDNSFVEHNDPPAKPIDSERQKIIIKLLVTKEPATATDIATLLGMRYQDALAAIRATIAGVHDE